MDVPLCSCTLGSKTLPSAGLQLNTIYLRQAWMCQALQEEIYIKNYLWLRENKDEESGSAWFQPMLADDALGTDGGRHKKELGLFTHGSVVMGCSWV